MRFCFRLGSFLDTSGTINLVDKSNVTKTGNYTNLWTGSPVFIKNCPYLLIEPELGGSLVFVYNFI